MAETAESREEIPMTEEQKFLFDLKGWIAIPGVLNPEEVAEVKGYIFTLRDHPENVPDHERNVWSGPCQPLLNHPVVTGILQEIIASDMPAQNGREAYGFRLDAASWLVREAGQGEWGPHCGGPMGPTHSYSFRNGKMLSPANRVVWELEPIRHGDGGTLFLSGSHKSNYPVQAAFLQKPGPLFEDYECPAGSVLVFSENICHSATRWNNQDHPRISLFYHYMYYAMQFHRGHEPPHETIMKMPPKRRSLFRGVWMMDFTPGKKFKDLQERNNDYYSEDNRAL